MELVIPVLIGSVIIGYVVLRIRRSKREQQNFMQLHGRDPSAPEAQLTKCLWKNDIWGAKALLENISEKTDRLLFVQEFLSLTWELAQAHNVFLSGVGMPEDETDRQYRVRFEERYGSFSSWTPEHLRGKQEKHHVETARRFLRNVEKGHKWATQGDIEAWLVDLTERFPRSRLIVALSCYFRACHRDWKGMKRIASRLSEAEAPLDIFAEGATTGADFAMEMTAGPGA